MRKPGRPPTQPRYWHHTICTVCGEWEVDKYPTLTDARASVAEPDEAEFCTDAHGRVHVKSLRLTKDT